MPAAERARDRGRHIARVLSDGLATELREARLGAGLTQASVGRIAGLSQSHISRVERGRRASLRIGELSRHAAALGLRLSVKVYPDGSPVRDAGQLRLIGRFRADVAALFLWRTEVLIGRPGDLRAWDVVLDGPGSVGIDVETRLRDIQAIQRRCEAKYRDSGVDRLVLVIGDTRHNRSVLREHRAALFSTFPADTAEVRRALRRGLLPPRNGIVVI